MYCCSENGTHNHLVHLKYPHLSYGDKKSHEHHLNSWIQLLIVKHPSRNV